jgi:DNA-binding FadR family transcriptional regulator
LDLNNRINQISQFNQIILNLIMSRPSSNPTFLGYLASLTNEDNNQVSSTRVPPLNELSKELGISVASLREQLEVAKALGLVEVRPHTGIRRQPYSFFPAVHKSLSFAIQLNREYFEAFADLRNHIEASYWDQAVRLLTNDDHEKLQALINQAWEKLRGNPIQIPHDEHRQLHLGIYQRLENPFVIGILEAYWEAYEAIGLNLYAGYDYLQQVWNYHQQMVAAICRCDFEDGYRVLVKHKDLLYDRYQPHDKTDRNPPDK